MRLGGVRIGGRSMCPPTRQGQLFSHMSGMVHRRRDTLVMKQVVMCMATTVWESSSDPTLEGRPVEVIFCPKLVEDIRMSDLIRTPLDQN
ncbi:hypothetical protein FNV43_RR00696 [Rhamnella rubrinervis]|uniref:Uncharacterized protein n=1 Tax=Rhamnella rubrinervis TaxID=2594499 RepID=A0A8K0MS94_9ROSA|nr:hypothetical protein FNV43_RR00696 [Rhamnella rubrinervis]